MSLPFGDGLPGRPSVCSCPGAHGPAGLRCLPTGGGQKTFPRQRPSAVALQALVRRLLGNRALRWGWQGSVRRIVDRARRRRLLSSEPRHRQAGRQAPRTLVRLGKGAHRPPSGAMDQSTWPSRRAQVGSVAAGGGPRSGSPFNVESSSRCRNRNVGIPTKAAMRTCHLRTHAPDVRAAGPGPWAQLEMARNRVGSRSPQSRVPGQGRERRRRDDLPLAVTRPRRVCGPRARHGRQAGPGRRPAVSGLVLLHTPELKGRDPADAAAAERITRGRERREHARDGRLQALLPHGFLVGQLQLPLAGFPVPRRWRHNTYPGIW